MRERERESVCVCVINSNIASYYMKYEENTRAHTRASTDENHDDDENVYVSDSATWIVPCVNFFFNTLVSTTTPVPVSHSAVLKYFLFFHKIFCECSLFQQFSTRARGMHKCFNNLPLSLQLLLHLKLDAFQHTPLIHTDMCLRAHTRTHARTSCLLGCEIEK